MKYSLTQSIFDYCNQFKSYSWLVISSASLLVLSSNLPSTATPVQIAQVGVNSRINRPNLQIGSRGERVLELQAALKLLGFYTGTVDGIYQQSTGQAVSRFKQAAGLIPNTIVDNTTWQRLFPNVSIIANNRPGNTVNTTVSNPFSVPTQSTINPRFNNTPLPRPQPNLPTQVPTRRTPATTPTSRNTRNTRNASNISIQPTPVNQRDPNFQYTSAGWPILRLGNGGPEVMKLQKLLQTLGFLRGRVDGDFGVGTQAAVKAAQARYGLDPDGVVGAATWQAFLRRLR